MNVNTIVLHTTEGTSLPTYDGGAVAPNFTAVPDFKNQRLNWFQHFDFDVSSRALVNLSGGVQTNTLNVSQVELTGTCDPKAHAKWKGAHIYWPEAPAWALRDLAAFLAWAHTEHGVPLSGPSKWPAYPTSYANGGGQRLSFAAWSAFSGICGHMHAAENVHGDPGAIDFPELIRLAKAKAGGSAPSTPTPKPKPVYAAFPGEAWFKKNPNSALVTRMGKRLVAEACGRYASGPGPRWTEADRASYRAWQRKCGYSGTAADGWPGKASWDRLKVPSA
ncbi:peptidoglycan-binding protein [Streptomyces sp. NPDC050507]|uniref:peptidoglycan-binding protein n=1 Tax=Streptomyces sp. NPDC050507 TaxID=3365619 RepID=UPI00378E2086